MFYSQPIHDRLSNICFYSQPIPDKLANGIIENYQITQIDVSTGVSESVLVGNANNYRLLRVTDTSNYILEVRGQTRAGLSPFASSLRIPSHAESKY